MTATLLLDLRAPELPEHLHDAADLIETAMARTGFRGITASEAGRAAHVDVLTASQILHWMVACQDAHTDHRGGGAHYYAGRPD
jgi:hypothetical protein